MLSAKVTRQRISVVKYAATSNFLELIKLARLDPAIHFRFADWSGADFSSCDLSGFDFAGANLTDCNFAGALIAKANFAGATLDSRALERAADWQEYLAGAARISVESPDGSKGYTPLFNRIALIGLGLIGSSLSLAIQRRKLGRDIVGHSQTKKTMDAALRLKLVSDVMPDPAAAVRDADLVVLCVPASACGPIVERVAASLKPGAILTDVCPVKVSVIQDVERYLPSGASFVPSHPVIEAALSGPQSGVPTLFDRRPCVLTPRSAVSKVAVDRVRGLWTGCGARVELMTAEAHDLIFAMVSHVPRLLASNLIGTAEDLGRVTELEIKKYSSPVFQEMAKIASSDPSVWQDVFINNREAILEILGRFSEDLAALQRALRWGDNNAVYEAMERTKAAGKQYINEEPE